MFNWLHQLKNYFRLPIMTLGNAKILTMLAIIYSDDKASIEREMQLLDALCTLDDNVHQKDMEHLMVTFHSLEQEHLFFYIAEYITDRNSKINLMASAYLIASIDEYISNHEQKLLVKIGQILQLTLEDINMVLEHTAYAVKCFNEWFFLDVSTSLSEQDVEFPEVITRALLKVIYADDPSDIPNKMDLMQAIFSFDPRLSNVNIQEIHSKFNQKQDFGIQQVVDEISQVITDQEGQERFISYCFLISLVDGSLSEAEIALIQALSQSFRFSEEKATQLQQRTQQLISTLQELQILQKDVLHSDSSNELMNAL